MPRKGPPSAAIMERRAPAEVEADDAERAFWRTLDYFPTPPWAARAVAETVAELDQSALVVREPACGAGHMAGPLREYFPIVDATDVHAHAPTTEVRDWLDERAWPDKPDCSWVITNPPFALAERFVTLGLQRAHVGVALLLRLSFLEGQERHGLLAGGEHPLTQVSVFSERVSMTLGRWDPASSLASSYAVFVWMKGAAPKPLRWIPPGTRARLWKADDAARYGWSEPLPLFPEPGGLAPEPDAAQRST